jgi:ADP-heptose:LPS heptosyltransferase
LRARNTRVLIFRACAIGDFVLNLPALIALRQQLGQNVCFTLVGYSSRLEIAREFLPNDAIEAIHSIDSPPWSALFAGPVEKLSFDAAIVWMKDDSVALNLHQSGISCVIRADPFPSSGHAADHLLHTLNLQPPPLPDLWTRSSNQLIVQPGSGSRMKCWPYFDRLMNALVARGTSAVFLTGPNEQDFETRHAKLKDLTLLQVIRELRTCGGYIGNDSGITHLAAYLGVPTVALFGPTDPAMWAPWGRRLRVFWKPGLGEISVEEVIEYAEWLLTNPWT